MSLQNKYSDSSSDESVCFGPYTIEEAKKDVRKCVPKKINTRHSSICRYRHYDISQEIQALTDQLVESTISSNPSYYQTADDTDATEEKFKSSEFLEKLTKVINEPVSGSTSYNTASEQENGSSTQRDILDSSIVTISDDSSSQLTHDDDDDLEESRSPVMTHMAERCQENISEAINDEFLPVKCEVLDISYSSVDVQDEVEDCDFRLSNVSKPKDFVKSDVVQDVNTDGGNILHDSFDSLDVISPTPQENHEGSFFNPKQLSKISEKSEFTTYSDTRPSTDRAAPTEIPEIVIEQHETSPVQVPEINLNQFDDSCDLDDTLEEMNRFLEQATDYVMPEETTPAKPKASPDKPTFSPKDIPKDLFSPKSGSFINNRSRENLVESGSTHIPTVTPKKFYSAEKVCKPSVEDRGPKTTAKSKFHHAESKLRQPIALFAKSSHHVPRTESTFKVPSKPAKKLHHTPGKIHNPALKNVVSPIGLYINHSPKYHPMVNVSPAKPLSKTKFDFDLPGPSSYKENIPASSDMEIPTVIYKPAKMKRPTEAPDVKLPGNIRKLISPQVVTKHERRIKKEDACNQSIERRLMESDLSIDVSQCNDEDISILTHKQPFNLRKF